MYTLIATDAEQRVVGKLPITRQVQTIGRASECSLTLPSQGVSRTHATVTLRADGVLIHDEGSANGVRVNGQPISGPVLIDAASVVQISEYTLRLQSMATEAAVAVERPPPQARPDESPQIDGSQPEYDTHLEVVSGAGSALARRQLVLLGRGGAYDGAQIKLDKVLVTVGRDETNDIVLDDPSISRRHAQLRVAVTADRLTVLDLRSANGTYVDGQRVKRAEAQQDSVLRFGDLAFRLNVDQPAIKQAAGKKRSPRRRLLAVVAVTVLLATAGGIALHLRNRQHREGPSVEPTNPLTEAQNRAQETLRQARTKLQVREWAQVIGVLSAFLEDEPLNSEARALLSQANEELGNARDLKRSRALVKQGDPASLLAARRILEGLPSTSTYQRDASYSIKNINDRLARHYLEQGRSLCERRERKRCYAVLCRYFGYVSGTRQSPDEQSARKQMRAIERHKRARRGLQKCTRPRYLRPPARSLSSAGPEAALAARYPSSKLRRAMRLYHRGEVDAAIRLLRGLSDRDADGLPGQVEQLRSLVVRARGKYREGFAAFREQRNSEAEGIWTALLKIDGQLMPAETASFYRRDATAKLGTLLLEMGQEHYRMGRLEKAYRTWRRGREVAPDNAQLQAGLFSLEKKARGLVGEARELLDAGRRTEARERLLRATRIVDSGAQRAAAEALLSQLK